VASPDVDEFDKDDERQKALRKLTEAYVDRTITTRQFTDAGLDLFGTDDE
jgi:hypothetical protein